ncbi:hypothetical protein OH77DRAFT_402102 [Trametes cingulata]|nr:hypothetical protein OH77DRAFT_402102 [Trametes cingulata]
MIATLYAKERGSAPADDPHKPSTIILHYDIPVVPHVPVQTGQKIRIVRLIPSPMPITSHNDPQPPFYTVQETGIVGTVITIRAMEKTVTEFVVRNENDQSPVSAAYIAVEHLPGTTVRLSLCESLIRLALSPFLPSTRRIPIERNAVVLRNVTRLRPERERGRTVGGESRMEDEMMVASEIWLNEHFGGAEAGSERGIDITERA